MVFSSILFISAFLPAVFCLHLVLPWVWARNWLLLAASLVFYAYGEPVYVLVMLFCALMNYFFGLAVQKGRRMARTAVRTAAVLDIGMLALFKYTGIAMPIGISFYTFQALSYVIDVYRGKVEAQRNFPKVLLYISFFPQLIAGPIVKYRDIAAEIEQRKVTVEGAAFGLRRFSAGLAKKVLIANVVGQTADALFTAGLSDINFVTAWIAAISYLLQIYFDFSGYSDMALGMGEMFGFHFKENFDYPYTADSIRNFWRKWHISLSSWFREYLYFPLGGNRKGRFRTVCNKWIVFCCTGLWHGASATFLFWGMYHGFFLMLEEYIPAPKARGRLLAAAKHIYTLFVVTVGFVIFRADTLSHGFYMIKEMLWGFHFEPAAISLALQQLTPLYLTVAAAAVLAALPVRPYLAKRKGFETLSWACSLCALALCILSLSSGAYNPFIYFRF